MFLSIKTINEINYPVLPKQHVLNALTSEHEIDVSAQVNNKKVLKTQHKDPTIHCGDLCPEKTTQLMSGLPVAVNKMAAPFIKNSISFLSEEITAQRERCCCVSTDGWSGTRGSLLRFHASPELISVYRQCFKASSERSITYDEVTGQRSADG